MKYSSEEDFGKDLVKILRLLGYQTWQEVSLGLDKPTIDIIAKTHNIYMSFELKLVLNDTVLIQAVKNLKYVTYSCVAIPLHTRKRWRASEVKKFYAKANGLGIFMLDIKLALKTLEKDKYTHDDLHMSSFSIPGIEAILIPKASRTHVDHEYLDIERYLHDSQKENRAGVDTSHSNLTPFQHSCVLIKEYLEMYPNSTKKQVWDAIHDKLHWASYSSLYGAFRQLGHTKWMRDIKFKG